jgi:hypothetical protein
MNAGCTDALGTYDVYPPVKHGAVCVLLRSAMPTRDGSEVVLIGQRLPVEGRARE